MALSRSRAARPEVERGAQRGIARHQLTVPRLRG